MDILLLTSTFHPLTGGAETYAQLLAQGLAAAGHRVTVATDGSWLSDRPIVEHVDGYRVLRPREFAEVVDARDKVKWRQMQYSVLNELGQLLAGQRFDLVHANSHECLVLAAMIALDGDSALVASLHEQNPDLEPYGLGRCRLSYQTLPVRVVLAASRFYLERARRFGVPPERVRLVYHGVAIEPRGAEDRARERRRLGVGDDELLLVCPGRIYTRKGQVHLGGALPAIRAALPAVRVLFAGRISDFGYAERLRQLLAAGGVADVVTFDETRTASDMPDVYAAADVVVQPSLEEGLGLTVIEAMAAGRPVVASDVVGIEEVVTHEHDGLLVPPADPERLARAVIAMATSPALAADCAAAALATVRERFTQERMVAETLAAYEAALNEGASGRPAP